MSKSSEKSSSSVEKFEDALKSARSEVQGMKNDLELLQSGFKNAFELTLTKSVKQASVNLELARKKLSEARNEMALYGMGAGGGITLFGQSPEEKVAEAKEAVRLAVLELAAARQLSKQEEQRARDASVVNQLQEARIILRDQEAKAQKEQAEAQVESQQRLNRISVIMSQIRAETEDAAKAAKDFTDNLVLGKGFLDASVRSGVASGAIPPSALGDLDQTDAEKAMERVLASRRREARKGSGSVSSKDSLVSDPLADLNKRIALDTKLLGVSEERAEVLRVIANSDKEYSQSAIEGAIFRLEVYNKEAELLEEAAAKQQQIADTMKTSMEDAFMSIVDGTKSAEDAFKDMARMIISELYKVLVVQQLVGSFQTGGGGILGSLAPIFGRASGGTVMSNTPYLVGEKGPEVIVPQNRGHVMNADLTAKAMNGSGGAVNIVQNFNFSANGDDSVKKLIAQAAPQIANMTQKQILDSRRRGGAMKSTFG